MNSHDRAYREVVRIRVRCLRWTKCQSCVSCQVAILPIAFPPPSPRCISPCDVWRFLLVVIVGYQRNAWKRSSTVRRQDRVEVELEVKLFQGLVGGLPDKPGDYETKGFGLANMHVQTRHKGQKHSGLKNIH